ncbi:hypothetical protein QNI16_33150 [Cytophagaceae bacterium YF14B1]|uniref:Uncharacterized protein n=2 Tax=Xanthocytophaga flava TaxID=3048013 RepID=A0AAE3UAB8_9BACT|nr:hypothetical protein [Xanthocytophaga flavus]MDJ1468117.1 hypothetical protein [Xanthocytophaga flavus]MDJ1485386.1 hypothetical protein [Xanthocytophaga flavus]
MTIKNTEGLTVQDILGEIQYGGKFVYFEFTVSVLVMTFKKPTDIYFIRSGESHWGKSLPFTLLSLFFGWWGFPWGIIYTPMALITNLSGGKDVTQQVLQSISSSPVDSIN